jgi:hypothetical protein
MVVMAFQTDQFTGLQIDCLFQICRILLVFRPRGVPGPTSKLSPRVPAQMGRRETEHEGGKKQAKGETRGLRVALRPGRVRLQ